MFSEKEWDNIFGSDPFIELSSTERKYLALAYIDESWDVKKYVSKTKLWYTRVIAFFDSDTIVKVIIEQNQVWKDGTINYRSYCEYDTTLKTSEGMLLPLTDRGKVKKFSASTISSIPAFGCEIDFSKRRQDGAFLLLKNPRANKEFPIGETERIEKIQNNTDFHSFMEYYINTCASDYFDKLAAFKNAKKVTVRYKPGDIFRVDYDRTHYGYGLITGTVKQFLSMKDLPEDHSLRSLMTVPIMIRPYKLLSSKSDLKAEDLSSVPLGRMMICSDNDIIWGTHAIVDHKKLQPNEIEFHLVCSKVINRTPHTTLFTQDMLIKDKLIPDLGYNLYVEWGFAHTYISFSKISNKLKEYLKDYFSPHGGVRMGIPTYIFDDNKFRSDYSYKMDLLNTENDEFRKELFSCLGLPDNADFDTFNKAFGGLSKYQICKRINAGKKN